MPSRITSTLLKRCKKYFGTTKEMGGDLGSYFLLPDGNYLDVDYFHDSIFYCLPRRGRDPWEEDQALGDEVEDWRSLHGMSPADYFQRQTGAIRYSKEPEPNIDINLTIPPNEIQLRTIIRECDEFEGCKYDIYHKNGKRCASGSASSGREFMQAYRRCVLK